jgi:hypothetical protein
VILILLLVAFQVPYLYQTGVYYSRLYHHSRITTLLANVPVPRTLDQEGEEEGPITAVASNNFLAESADAVSQNLSSSVPPLRTRNSALATAIAAHTVQSPGPEHSATNRSIAASRGAAIVPPWLYDAQEDRPLAVRWIGRWNDEDGIDNSAANTPRAVTFSFPSSSSSLLWEDAVLRSHYMAPIQACWYNGAPFPPHRGNHSSERRRGRKRGVVDRVKGTHFLALDTKNHQSSSTSSNDVVVTMVDWAALERDCHVLWRILAHPECQLDEEEAGGSAQQQQQQLFLKKRRHLLVYWDSSNSPHPKVCGTLLRAMLPSSFFDSIDGSYYVQLSTVQGRQWDADRDYINPGQRPSHDNQRQIHSKDIVGWHQSWYPLREAFVRKLVNATTASGKDERVLRSLPFRKHRWRQVSVLHDPTNHGVPYSAFQDRVNGAVLDIARQRNLTHQFVEVVKWGRTTKTNADASIRNDGQLVVHPREYVNTLLTSQIVVIASHDEWEGDWRLWEIMASGAMVLAEAMVSPPPGLENGTNVITFDSISSLDRLLLHYLRNDDERRRIAQRGQQLALGQHRSWHDLERVMFGRPLSHAPRRHALRLRGTEEKKEDDHSQELVQEG